MKLLHLTPELPHAPGGTGGATRQFQLVRGLVRRGHEVSVVAPVAPFQAEGAARLREAGVRLFGAPRPASRVSESLRALSRSPGLIKRALRDPVLAWQVEVFWTALRPLAREALADQPDVVLVEHDWAAAWHRDLPPVPRALTLHNLSWRYYAARAAAASGVQAVGLGVEARRFASFDRRHLRAYDVLLAMSDQDRDLAARLTGTRVEAVPNGVDTSALGPFGEPDGPPTLLYAGTLDYAPNAEGLRWLLREVWPRVTAEAELVVVGRNPPEDAMRSAGPGVTFAGRVPEIAPYFARATAVLVPLLSGAGTKLKVLDGLSSGRPVVSTSVGVEGIAAEDARHLLIADGAEAFAAAVTRVVDDAGLRARLGAEGRALAEQRYDWQVLSARFESILGSLL